MIKKIFIIIKNILILLLPLLILIFSFFYNKLYILNVTTKNCNDISKCLDLDNISFENMSDLKRIEVSKPFFSDVEEFHFFYSDEKNYYKYSDNTDMSNLKTYIENNCFSISNFKYIIFIFSCILVILKILNPIIKLIISFFANN